MDTTKLLKILIGVLVVVLLGLATIAYWDKNRDVGQGFSEMIRKKNEMMELKREGGKREVWGAQ